MGRASEGGGGAGAPTLCKKKMINAVKYICHSEIYRLSGLVGRPENSPDNQKYEYLIKLH